MTAGKPTLTLEILLAAGFTRASAFTLVDGGRLSLHEPLSSQHGVYALLVRGVAVYVGIAATGYSKRLGFYIRPGKTQRTSHRINQLLIEELAGGSDIEIYVACPPDGDWNGLHVNTAAGLEAGLIATFHLPWNIRGANTARVGTA